MEITKQCVICSRSYTTTKEHVVTCSQRCHASRCGRITQDRLRKDAVLATSVRTRISRSKLGSRNPQWKGDAVGYASLHEWVNIHKPRPELCEICKAVPPVDLANKGVYDRNFDNWEYLCRKCHMVKDGRLVRLHIAKRERRDSDAINSKSE